MRDNGNMRYITDREIRDIGDTVREKRMLGVGEKREK